MYYDSALDQKSRARLERLGRAGLPAVARLRRLAGREYARPEQCWMEAGSLLSRASRAALSRWLQAGKESPLVRVPADPIGFNANGWQGQYLAVYPRWNLVVVRLRQPVSFTEEENKRYGFWRFFSLVGGLVKQRPR